tara:strand:- start:29 stop:253 length:225 start_codon:yes stop_codon:yes gene_type:complete
MKTLYFQPVKGSYPGARSLIDLPVDQRLPFQMTLGHSYRIFLTASDKARHFGPSGGLSRVAVADVEAPVQFAVA